ncbi:hypothetical protein CANTEDRAFT_115654 [Yamadazyma tenuis ATCC 10573]|uniref:Uncharacterized protein n=3 Tax=Candida tenuis TaxID=2315449 RepID=G3BBG5_CANTC|nr:uncharacterized protein CANTEDRAFT_115654 [Yamadazyma tenuis ATCC 10573]EGV62185.1 hypothetical protein CANTEDRAFT_115654 [Yamadazyma tenuis ATCC 10573]
MDTLLEKLRSSAAKSSDTKSSEDTGSATSRDKRVDRRRKALSFYSSPSVDQLEDNSKNGSELSFNDYESVNDLKRRLTRRRKDGVGGNHSSSSVNSDTTLLRTQAMLSRLRQEELKSGELSVSSD